MSIYQKAAMLTGQFLTVLGHDSTVTRGTIEVRADGVWINPADAEYPVRKK